MLKITPISEDSVELSGVVDCPTVVIGNLIVTGSLCLNANLTTHGNFTVTTAGVVSSSAAATMIVGANFEVKEAVPEQSVKEYEPMNKELMKQIDAKVKESGETRASV